MSTKVDLVVVAVVLVYQDLNHVQVIFSESLYRFCFFFIM